MDWPVVSDDAAVQAAYEDLRRDGTPHTLAEMFVLRQAPGSKTDREFLAGHCNGNQFERDARRGDYYAQVAKEQGADITGKVYLSGLAAYPGDPQAWVSGRSDVRRVVEERGWSCDGDVKVQGPGITKAAEPVRLAPDIVEREVKRLVRREPGLAKKPRRELAERVIAEKGPSHE